MYGSYGMYSGNKCNFSSSTMYKPAGVVTMTSGYQMSGNGLDRSHSGGVPTSVPSNSCTSTIVGITKSSNESFQQLSNVSSSVQHIDYQQNPSPVVLSVRQLDNSNPSKQKIYIDVSSGMPGLYTQQYVLPGISQIYSTNTTNQQTTIYEQQNIVHHPTSSSQTHDSPQTSRPPPSAPTFASIDVPPQSAPV